MEKFIYDCKKNVCKNLIVPDEFSVFVFLKKMNVKRCNYGYIVSLFFPPSINLYFYDILDEQQQHPQRAPFCFICSFYFVLVYSWVTLFIWLRMRTWMRMITVVLQTFIAQNISFYQIFRFQYFDQHGLLCPDWCTLFRNGYSDITGNWHHWNTAPSSSSGLLIEFTDLTFSE